MGIDGQQNSIGGKMGYNPRDRYYIYDLPVPYKKLLIYPVKMKDYITFQILASCLMLEKNSIPDPKIIKMTYLEYMFYADTAENNYVALFDALMRFVLGKAEDRQFEIIYKKQNGRPVFEIDGATYNSEDFDNLRELIAEQNYLELPDETIQKTVRDAMEETRKYRQKMSNEKTASLEDQMIAVAVYTGWDLEKIYELTIRKFMKALLRANQIIMSTIYLTASLSGMVEFKDKSVLKSWLTDLEDVDKFKDTVSVEEIQSKVDFSSAKK